MTEAVIIDLLCKQWTGFYTITASAIKELNKSLLFILDYAVRFSKSFRKSLLSLQQVEQAQFVP